MTAEQEQRESRLADYYAAMVTVYYTASYSDNGRLTYLDSSWIELTKDSGERLLIPIAAVRIVKLMEPPKRNPDAEILLRAVDVKPEVQPETRRLDR